MSDPKRDRLAEAALEACRGEVVRRLGNRGLPTAFDDHRLVVIDNEEGTGWTSEWRKVSVSPLRSLDVMKAIGDSSVPYRELGLRDQLMKLAEYLHESTDLGSKRQEGLLPDATGHDAILARYLVPFASEYVSQLDDVAVPDSALAKRLVNELGLICEPSKVVRAFQLVLDGVTVSQPMTITDVSIRPLSPPERGMVLRQHTWLMGSDAAIRDFVVPQRFLFWLPSVMIEVSDKRNRAETYEEPNLLYRVALSFFLSGFDISATGLVMSFDQPRWAAMGVSPMPFPILEKQGVARRSLSKAAFRSVVELAHKIPLFTSAERNRREVVLFRLLRGCGAHQPGTRFLDLAFCLEAALLGGIKEELRYRFSLYGSLFLSDRLDPARTFRRLRGIYDVRSDLVHGTPVPRRKLLSAEQDAADLAKAVVHKAILDGWPESKELDKLALDVPSIRKG